MGQGTSQSLCAAFPCTASELLMDDADDGASLLMQVSVLPSEPSLRVGRDKTTFGEFSGPSTDRHTHLSGSTKHPAPDGDREHVSGGRTPRSGSMPVVAPWCVSNDKRVKMNAVLETDWCPKDGARGKCRSRPEAGAGGDARLPAAEVQSRTQSRMNFPPPREGAMPPMMDIQARTLSRGN
mmetsp:Transcript_74461/g.206804  ORF Transcript_74461/g.206804 Transcript_74461/m.206804 type:complete len:181 (-) Transcript_74461:182-724(-)